MLFCIKERKELIYRDTTTEISYDVDESMGV